MKEIQLANNKGVVLVDNEDYKHAKKMFGEYAYLNEV